MVFLALAGYSQSFTLKNLRTNNHNSPIGIDQKPPVFSWETGTTVRGFMQTACQVIITDNYSSAENGIGNIWNSGKIRTSQSIQFAYGGNQLLPEKKYYWRVKVWDKNNRHQWSAVDSFSTAIFDSKGWGDAKWIGYEELPDSMRVVPGVHHPNANQLGNRALKRAVVPLFRKEFGVSKKIKTATAFISGLGHYEFLLNGKKVGNSFIAPGWTFYDKRVLYNIYDVTDLIKQGGNAIGVIVGNGFHNVNRERYYKLIVAFGLPKMICKIKITYEDGSSSVVVSDASWKTTASAITYSGIFAGEDYDARLEQEGWHLPGFNDVSWKNALPVKPPLGSMEPESLYPVTVKERFTPKKIWQPRPGVFIYDFGQNASAFVELKVKGKRGQTIKLTPSELLPKDQMANQKATGEPYYFSYTLKGEGIETWQPLFSYYGFRYVQVEGAVPDTAQNNEGLPQIISLNEMHNCTSAPENGTFESSNDLFNRINSLIKWAIQSNLQSVVTDCPHREKLSWLEVDHLMGNSINYNFDVYHLYRKLVYDMMDAQTPEGLVPDIAPEYVQLYSGFRDSPEWGSSSVILPWLIYKWYGDTDILRDAFPMMKKYVAYLESKSDNHILSHGLGDWFDYGPKSPGAAQLTPKELTATAIYYYDLTVMAKIAILTGDQQEAVRLKEKAGKVKMAFNKKFFNPLTKVFSTGSQTAMSMPLCVGLVDEEHRPAVFKNLVDSIVATGKKLTAGDVGYHYLVEALHAGGVSWLLFDMNYRDDVPGYGFQLKKGATTLTESWPALEEVSNNHLMLGHIMEWFYYGISGISQAENSVGYKNIIIRPEPVGDLTHAKGTFKTPYGLISSEWKTDNGNFTLDIHIPPNTTADVSLPFIPGAAISLDGKPVEKSKDAKVMGTKGNKRIIRIGSGTYRFNANLGGL